MLYSLLVLAAAAEGGATTDVVSMIITSVVSATVFSALITGLVQFLMNRRNSRVTERKNAVDEESDLVSRYKEAASEERAAKESAVRTIKELLENSQEQIVSLKGTVETLNNTIKLMETLAVSQKSVIDQLTSDRDRTQAALDRAEDRIREQTEELIQKQKEIQSLYEQSRLKVSEARSVIETFDTAVDVVE